jgi:hypothetical protein
MPLPLRKLPVFQSPPPRHPIDDWLKSKLLPASSSIEPSDDCRVELTDCDSSHVICIIERGIVPVSTYALNLTPPKDTSARVIPPLMMTSLNPTPIPINSISEPSHLSWGQTPRITARVQSLHHGSVLLTNVALLIGHDGNSNRCPSWRSGVNLLHSSQVWHYGWTDETA